MHRCILSRIHIPLTLRTYFYKVNLLLIAARRNYSSNFSFVSRRVCTRNERIQSRLERREVADQYLFTVLVRIHTATVVTNCRDSLLCIPTSQDGREKPCLNRLERARGQHEYFGGQTVVEVIFAHVLPDGTALFSLCSTKWSLTPLHPSKILRRSSVFCRFQGLNVITKRALFYLPPPSATYCAWLTSRYYFIFHQTLLCRVSANNNKKNTAKWQNTKYHEQPKADVKQCFQPQQKH